MASKENRVPTNAAAAANGTSKQGQKRPREEPESDLFLMGPRRKAGKTDRLVSYGRYFGRTVRTFCNFHVLVKEGVTREEQMASNGVDIDELNDRERHEHSVFRELLRICPALGKQLFAMERTDDTLVYAADMLAKGANTARADDVKTLKSAVVDWITPEGGSLKPTINRNSKNGRGFQHQVTGRYLCPTDYNWDDENIRRQLRSGQLVVSGLQWPMLLYQDLKCNEDDMWEGLLRAQILVQWRWNAQAFKHVFTSPSSVDGDTRATRSGNAQIHGMTSVTIPSIAYIATLVRFSLTSASTFSRSDKTTDSQRFYNTLISFLEEGAERRNVEKLLEWWNQQIFPGLSMEGFHSLPETCAIAKLKKQSLRRAALTEVAGNTGNQPTQAPSTHPRAVGL
ncbi:hypothetical protein NMY22_g9063 [Coprinellus aureogranulatus]|nr:hypothetical protein NMY22_g9063 [Coprinellus aureogranulatus]